MVDFSRFLTAVLIAAAASANAQKACPEGIRELEYICQCSEVKVDALYDSGKSCKLIAAGSTSSFPPPLVSIRPSGNNRGFILLEPMSYEIGTTGLVITVPAGFVTDFASIPPELWSFYSPHDQYSRAAVLHDYLYWSQLCTRLQADNLFLVAMKESEVSWITRNVVHWGVRRAGGRAWEGNALERNKNMPKVVPLDRRDFPPNWEWERYRKEILIEQGVKDPAFVGNDYCVLGNSTDIPTTASHKELVKKALALPKIVERPLQTTRN